MGDIAEALVSQVRAAAANRTKLEIIGAGSKAFYGRVASGRPLDVAGHSGIVDYQPSELVMSVRAGTKLKDISNALLEHGQTIPFEASTYDGQATLGGTLACGMSGPARPWKGSVRDAILGVRLINGRGEHLHFGGKVLKNVAGYDVSRLQAGAMGTLGVITEVTFRVLPKAAATLNLGREMDASEAIQRMNQLAGLPYPISGAAWVSGKLHLRLEGATAALETLDKQLGMDEEPEAHRVWEGIRDQSLDYFGGDLPTWRFSVDPKADHIMDEERWLIDWAGSQRWLRGEFQHGQLEEFAQEMGGHASKFRHCDRSSEVFHTLDPTLQTLQRNLKLSFDPNEIFNPGRMYSWM